MPKYLTTDNLSSVKLGFIPAGSIYDAEAAGASPDEIEMLIGLDALRREPLSADEIAALEAGGKPKNPPASDQPTSPGGLGSAKQKK